MKSLILFLLLLSSSLAGQVEFVGIFSLGGNEYFSLVNRETDARSGWVKVGERFQGYRIESYNRDEGILVLASADGPLSLTLRQSILKVAGAARPDEEPQTEFAGIGIVMHGGEDGPRIGGVLPGSPADKAGLSVGPLISAIDGISVAEKEFRETAEMVRGRVGTIVRLEVIDPENGAKREVSLIRERLTLPVLPDEASTIEED